MWYVLALVGRWISHIQIGPGAAEQLLQASGPLVRESGFITIIHTHSVQSLRASSRYLLARRRMEALHREYIRHCHDGEILLGIRLL
jgi:hypothetical protein